MSTSAAATALSTRLLSGFDDPALAALVAPSVFSTREYQRAWWETFGRGELLLALAEENGEPVAFAPLFTDGGMIYFVGAGGSDYLDFCGDVSGQRLPRMLLAASQRVDDFGGFVFYHIPDTSPTVAYLKTAAQQLGWQLVEQDEQPAPVLDLRQSQIALAAANKKKLVYFENALRKAGTLEVHHFRERDDIRPQLEAFFQQHIDRWSATPYPSLFHDPQQRAFYHRLCDTVGAAGFLRFTRVDLDGTAIAFHFGFCHRGVYVNYKPTFHLMFAKFSPGQVLLRHLLLAAIDEGAVTFDFGLGDEAYKSRFATHVNKVRNWGLYPPEAK